VQCGRPVHVGSVDVGMLPYQSPHRSQVSSPDGGQELGWRCRRGDDASRTHDDRERDRNQSGSPEEPVNFSRVASTFKRRVASAFRRKRAAGAELPAEAGSHAND
jgi:hypothetical protein